MKVFHPSPDGGTAHTTDPAVRIWILQAQSGSHEACRLLRAQYRPLLEASVARFGAAELSRQERMDLWEEAERVFLGAIFSYDTEQDAVDFGLYAKICLRNGLISELRHMDSRRRMTVLPLEGEPVGAVEDLAERVAEDERFRQLCRTVRGCLSDFENRVWWPYVTGVSVADIARELNCEERSVHNAIYRIRRKLRERLASPSGSD